MIEEQAPYPLSDAKLLPLLDQTNQAPPHWANESIQTWDDQLFRKLSPFILSTYWCDQGSINVHRVMGTQHPDYQGKTWLGFLNGGKRMAHNLPLHQSNRPYYLQTERKQPMMYYITFDGQSFYVAADGNHRTAIAKFDFHFTGLSTLHGVSITHHRIDWEFFRRYQALQALCAERRLAYVIAGGSHRIKREDTSGWKLDVFEPYLQVENRREGISETLDRGQSGALLESLRGKAHRRWWPWGGT